jgi:hypothetical protein
MRDSRNMLATCTGAARAQLMALGNVTKADIIFAGARCGMDRLMSGKSPRDRHGRMYLA